MTKFIILGPSKCLLLAVKVTSPLILSHIQKKPGVIFDFELCFDKQISAVIKNSFQQLIIIAKLKSYLSFHDLKKVIHAFLIIWEPQTEPEIIEDSGQHT